MIPIAPAARPLEAFFGLLARSLFAFEPPTMHPPHWHARIGEDLATGLIKLGVLVPRAAPADWFPCGGSRGSGCRRRVVPTFGYYGDRPFVAACGREDSACDDVFLHAEERVVWTVSIDDLVRHLRRALGIVGTIDRGDLGFPDVTKIGERGGRAVFLALSASTQGFAAWLGSRGDALVLATDGRGIATAVRDRFAVGQRVELVTLGEALRFEKGAFVGALAAPVGTREPSMPSATPTPTPTLVSLPSKGAPTTCTVIDQDGSRPLTAREYDALVGRPGEIDLFIDTTVVVDGGGHRARRRNDDGTATESVLTKYEAAALVELIAARRPLDARYLAAVGVNDVAKIIERARRKIDVRRGRYNWRAIHTLAGDRSESKRWLFTPEAGLTFAVVRPTAS